jgi:hypothetical protein
MRSSDLRRGAACLALVLAIATAAPAAAATPAWSGGWIDAVAGRLGAWWAAAWTGEPPLSSARAANEAAPRLDPNGVQQPPSDPGTLMSTEPTDDGEAAPRLDPNG